MTMTFRPAARIAPLSSWFARARARRKQNIAFNTLRALDDAALKDIGLHRSEISALCFGQDAGRRQRDV